MRVILIIVGVLLFLTGIVWILQGINVLPGSFMSGQIQYSFAGIVAAIIGIGLVVYARRQRGAPPTDEAEQGERKALDDAAEPKEDESD
jgi:hypothetical protein